MKWFYPLFILTAVLILGGSAYLIFFSPKAACPPATNAEIAVSQNAYQKGYQKFLGFFSAVPKLLSSPGFSLTFRGKIAKIASGGLTVSQDSQEASFTKEELAKAVFLDYDGSRAVKTLFDSFKTGETVEIKAVITPSDGKISVLTVGRVK